MSVSASNVSERDDFVEQLTTEDPREFVRHKILDRTPWIFPDARSYAIWRAALAKDLGLDPLAILVVGSACTRFSLNPKKNFSEFTLGGSDVDVAIISAHHFNEAWQWLRKMQDFDVSLSKRRQRMLERHRESLVFDGAIATEHLSEGLPFRTKWQAAFGHAAARDPTRVAKGVKGRVYSDLSALRQYHERNVNTLRLLQATGSTPGVPVDLPDDPVETLATFDEINQES